MKYLPAFILLAILTSCGAAGVAPNPDYAKTKGYDPGQDFVTAVGHPLYLFASQGQQSLPEDYPKDLGAKLSNDEKLLVNLEYYTPTNVQKIMDRISGFLTKAKNELSPADYEQVVPVTQYQRTAKMEMEKIILDRPHGSNEAGYDLNKGMQVVYDGTIFNHPAPWEAFGGSLDSIWAADGVDFDSLGNSMGVWRDTQTITLQPKYIEEKEYEALPTLKAAVEASKKIEDAYRSYYSVEGYQASLKELGTNPQTPITMILKSYKLRDQLETYLKTSVSPKYQEAVKQKAEAFFKAWGL